MTTLIFSALFTPEAEHSTGPLGIPVVVWQAANLIGFLAALFYFVARPLTRLFRQRQLDIERRIQEAQQRRAEAARLEAEIHERMARLDRDVAEIRARGVADGEAARVELIARADQDAENVRRQAEEEIGRRLEAARQELKRTAAELTAAAAHEMVAAQITEEDRRRLLTEGIARLESKA